MPTKQPQLAKLTRPRLHKAVARERLFALLDEARANKPAICVVGPPGAGKTTLVASWLDVRGIKGIWYQVDPGDADLATFFYYLGEAAKSFIRKGQRPLPLLTPEYLQDVDGFSRRFFRDLLGRLPQGAGLVLDNYQEVGPEQKFHQLIAQAAEDVPEGMTLIVISRRDPPDCYARLIANENVQLVDWNDLQLTFEETRQIVIRRAGRTRCHLRIFRCANLRTRTGGCPAIPDGDSFFANRAGQRRACTDRCACLRNHLGGSVPAASLCSSTTWTGAHLLVSRVVSGISAGSGR